MSIQYRLKRSSGPVHEPIPAHPDSIYRPQNRPTPASSDPIAPRVMAAPRTMDSNAVVAAPLAASESGFSPWWIIGPLLALLAAMALGALAYVMKKKHDLKKQTEEDNDPEKRETNDTKTNKSKEENPEDDDSARKSPIENVPLRSMNPNTILKEQKRTASTSSTIKDNLTSSTDPFPFSKFNNEQLDKSASSAHGLPPMYDSSTLSSAHSDKPNSDVFKQSNEENISKKVHNTLSGPQLVSSLKNIRSISTHNAEPNYSGNLPLTSTVSPTSSTVATTQKLGQSNDRSDLNADKLKSNAILNKKENQSNDFKKAFDDKSPFDQTLTNLGRVDHTGPLKLGQSKKEFTLPSSHSGTNDQNTENKPGDDHINQPNSPEQHGVGKSPLISNIPTGSRRSEREKAQSQANQTKEGQSSSKPSSSNPNLQQHSSKENTDSNKLKSPSSPSDINKDKQPSTLTIHSKYDPLSELSETASSNFVTSAEPTNEKNSTFSRPNEKSNERIVQPSDQYSMLNKNDLDKFGSRHIHSFTKGLDSNPLQSHIDPSHQQKSNNPNDDKSDESNTSLTKPNLINHNKIISLMPNVPQCKTNTSSDDDDYDEIYPIPTNNSSIQQTTKHETTDKPNSNLNINASTYRKNRTLHIHKPLTKRFHSKDKV